MQNIISTSQLTREWIEQLLFNIDHPAESSLSGKTLCTMFFEPSTRTRLSFETAALGLGMGVISVENADQNSSSTKGESLADTLRLIGNYTDIVAIRHPESGQIETNAHFSTVPVISAGSGSIDHPTQALIDAYTIWKKLGRLDNLRIAYVGDIENSRTVKALKTLLAKFDGNEIHNFPPPASKLVDALPNMDVVYLTRLQKERGSISDNYFVFDNTLADKLPEYAIILHALPRNHELPEEVDTNPRAAYFDQAANAVKVRMAIIQALLK